MRRRLFLVLLAALTLIAADKKKPKPAVIEIQSLKLTIDAAKVKIDGQLKNTGERAVQKLILSFHFFDTDHHPVSTLQLNVDDDNLNPGEETELHADAREPARAVSVEITAADRGERDIKVVKAGPYPIE